MAKIDLERLLSDFLSFEYKVDEKSPYKGYSFHEREIIRGAGCLIGMAMKGALMKQGLEYMNGKIEPSSKGHIWKNLPREEQLKWYVCIKDIGGNPPLFIEGEHATLEKIESYCPDITLTQFTEHFRKVTEEDLPNKEESDSICHKSDIDAMVAEFRNNLIADYGCHYIPIDGIVAAYKKGLEDMEQINEVDYGNKYKFSNTGRDV